ncbi:hypothetical protein [Candidatus Nitronereus thalassa]|uniref:Uncharacterized protein n=1 Tax=Candidatus Nitronereus thalassa TaxID=3020898 RepID=A0ABU3KBA8_9BACT|nr:hypothetical protein [Candidatus Nitronereus thalassa]MDT7043731.1 hypothetical protein [Candidatus Nitronereus thalassa]
MNSQETRTFFIKYINTCNLALRRHKDGLPYKQIIELGNKVLGGKNVIAKIYVDDLNQPVDAYTVRFNDGTIDVVSYDEEEAEHEWNLRESYIETVVQNSDDYIAHPEKLEWDWLKSRLQIGNE